MFDDVIMRYVTLLIGQKQKMEFKLKGKCQSNRDIVDRVIMRYVILLIGKKHKI